MYRILIDFISSMYSIPGVVLPLYPLISTLTHTHTLYLYTALIQVAN